MGKALNKIGYAIGDAAAAILDDGLDGILLLLYYSTPPFLPKALYGCKLQEFYSHQKLYRRVESLYKKGHIEKIGGRKKPGFLFSKKNRYGYIGPFVGEKARMFERGWDGQWRLILYDIPNKNRSVGRYIRSYLKGLGFGMLQKSCWLSCYDYSTELDKFLEERELSSYFCINTGKLYTGEDINTLVQKAWDLEKYDTGYHSIAEKACQDIRRIETESIDFNQYYLKYCELFAEFKKLLCEDPFLPKQFSSLWETRQAAEEATVTLARKLFKEAKIKL